MYRYLLPLVVLGGPAWAANCTFDRECFETEACTDANFLVQILSNDNILQTEFGDLPIIATKSGDDLQTIIAASDGADLLMTISPQGARLTQHMHQGPISITYFGQCEGAM